MNTAIGDIRTMFIAVVFIIISGCSQNRGLTADEKMIYDAMASFRIVADDGQESNLLAVATEFEKVLLGKKYLTSVSKQSYQMFFSRYVLGNSTIDLTLVYQGYPLFINLTYPSTLSRSWYIFDEILKKEISDPKTRLTLEKLNSVMAEMLQDFDFTQDHFNRYLNSVSDKDFEKKEIYRVPILILLYNQLAWKDSYSTTKDDLR
jgi:hypothetical protein